MLRATRVSPIFARAKLRALRRWLGLAALAWLSIPWPSSGRAGAQDDFDLDAPEPEVGVAATGPESATTKNPLEVAREHMERGQALYRAARYIESAEEFLSAYQAQPFSAFLFNAGVAYEKVDDPGRAADYFARFLQTDPQAANSTQLNARIDRLRGLARAREQELAAQSAAAGASGVDVERLKAELEAAQRQKSELEAQLAALGGRDNLRSLLSVQATPSDATVTVKDEAGKVLHEGAGQKFAQALDAGRYSVEVQHPKYKTISAPITVAAGEVHTVIAEMSQGQFLGFLRVQSDVPGANVYVDDKAAGALGRTPFQNAVKTGKHHVWIERPGYKPIERDVEIGVGDDMLLKVALERVEYGRIRVVSNRSDAVLYIDGKRIGRVPVETDVGHGEHDVSVSADGMKTWKQTVSVQRGQSTPLRVRLRPKMGRAGAWATSAVAAGVLGGSITVAVLGKKLDDEIKRDRSAGTLRSDDDRPNRAKWYYVAADVGFGVTLGLAGLATYYFLRDNRPDSEGRVLAPRDWAFNAVFAPDVSPDRVGGHLHVSF
jgi:tetratricopeptide (TPR) repeat protein